MKVLSSFITAAVVAKASALSQEEKLRLLRKAVPLSSRKLNNNQNAAYAITSAESIEFNACVSLTALPENEDQEFIASSDEMKALFEQGDIVSQTSVVLFGICTTGSCTGSDENLYVTDLGSYMQLAGYRPQKTFDYCEACKESQDYCEQLAAGDNVEEEEAAAEGEQAEDADAEANAEGEDAEGGRRLASAQYVNCTTCASLGCFADEQQQNENGQEQITLEGMVQWVQQQGECQQTGQYWNNMALYSSFMCNQEGTGVELALFLDDNCQLYTASTSYSSIYPDDQYVANSQNVVTYPFTNDIDCAADPEWRNPEEQANGEEQQQQQEEDGEDDVNDYCQALLNDGDVLELDNCYANGNNANENNNNNNNNNGDYYDYFSQWQYNLNGREEINTPAARCTALKNMQGEYVSFKTTKKSYNVYKKDTEHSGSNYSYKKTSSKSSLSGGAVAGIVIAVLVALGVGIVVARMYKKKKDSKREPLVAADGIGA